MSIVYMSWRTQKWEIPSSTFSFTQHRGCFRNFSSVCSRAFNLSINIRIHKSQEHDFTNQRTASLCGRPMISTHVGSLAESSIQHNTNQHDSTRDDASGRGCWLVEWGCPWSCRSHRQPSQRRLKRKWKGSGDDHSVAMDTALDLTLLMMGHTYEEHASLHLAGPSPCHLSKTTVVFYSSGIHNMYVHWVSLTFLPKICVFLFVLLLHEDTIDLLWWIFCKRRVSFTDSAQRRPCRCTRPLMQLIRQSRLTLWITCHTVWEWSSSKGPVLCCDLILLVFTACPLPVGLQPPGNASITRLLCMETHTSPLLIRMTKPSEFD